MASSVHPDADRDARPGERPGTLFGGVALALMDEAGAIVALRIARAPVVTAHIHSVDFRRHRQGEAVEVTATLVAWGARRCGIRGTRGGGPCSRASAGSARRRTFVFVAMAPTAVRRPCLPCRSRPAPEGTRRRSPDATGGRVEPPVPILEGPSPGACFSPPSRRRCGGAVEEVYRDGAIQRTCRSGHVRVPSRGRRPGGRSVRRGPPLDGRRRRGRPLVTCSSGKVSARGRRVAPLRRPACRRPTPRSSRRPLAAAEALARRGSGRGDPRPPAAHAPRRCRRQETVLPPALTSARSRPRPLVDHPARRSDLVLAVEVAASEGAGGPDDYARCLARWREFPAAYGRAA